MHSMDWKCPCLGFLLLCVPLAQALAPWQNWTLPVGERVADLVRRLTADEKLAQLSSDAPAISRLGISSFSWGHEALHGAVNKRGFATVFPQPIGLGATWDAALLRRIGTAISDEGRGLVNNGTWGKGTYGLSVWAPNVNIFRDPRWGRGHETYGDEEGGGGRAESEEKGQGQQRWQGRVSHFRCSCHLRCFLGESPRLSSTLQIQFVLGLQQGDASKPQAYWKLLSTPKHYAGYNLEICDGVSRHEFDAKISPRDLVDTYLPVFEAVVVEAGAHGIMCSYNSVNGVPACASEELLGGFLRTRMNFSGHVVSDCGAITDVYANHLYAPSLEAAAAATLKAGTDLDCGGAYAAALNQSSIDRGVITMAELDLTMTRVFTARMRLGEFDPASLQPYRQIPPSVVDSAEHRQLARTAAEEGLVLLKNENHTLPFPTSIRRVLLVGQHCNFTEVLLGNYHGIPSHVVTPLEAVQEWGTKFGFDVDYDIGMAIEGDGIWMLEDAVHKAKQADAVVVCAGLSSLKTGADGYANGYVNPALEKESMDRYTLRLPGTQRDIIKGAGAGYALDHIVQHPVSVPTSAQRCNQALHRQTSTPIALVLINGGAVAADWELEHLPAIVEAWYGGEEAGHAIADALFGAISPAGRLPVTMYAEQYISAMDYTDMSMTTPPGRSYRYLNDPKHEYILLPFGYGLSYTTFSVASLSVEPAVASGSAPRVLSAKAGRVSNTGPISSDFVFVAYVSTNAVSSDLFGLRQVLCFQRLHAVTPGESVAAVCDLDPSAFSYVDAHAQRVVTPGEYTVSVEGVNFTVTISS